MFPSSRRHTRTPPRQALRGFRHAHHLTLSPIYIWSTLVYDDAVLLRLRREHARPLRFTVQRTPLPELSSGSTADPWVAEPRPPRQGGIGHLLLHLRWGAGMLSTSTARPGTQQGPTFSRK